MANYATVEDIIILGRPLTSVETDKATALLPIVSATMREAALEVGKDLDIMIVKAADLGEIAKQICVDVTLRAINRDLNDSGGYSQMTQTAGSYSMTLSPIASGRSVVLLKNELSSLGLRRQQMGVMDLYDTTTN